MTDSKRKWRDNKNNYERHYCEICNVWMGSDRQSILLHENGKKHIENVERQLQDKRREKTAQDTEAAALAASLKQMEAAARSSMAQDLGYFAHVPYSANAVPPPPPTTSSYGMPYHSQQQQQQQQQHQFPQTVPSYTPLPPPPPRSQPLPPPAAASAPNEKKEWEIRKKQRLEEKTRDKSTKEEDETDYDNEISLQPNRRHIDPNEGHYTLDHDDDNNKNKTYLEATVFGDILEEDMPIQLWTGATNATLAEQRLPDRALYWKDALVAAVRQQQQQQQQQHANDNAQQQQQQQLLPQERLRVDVAYLQTPDATEETLERSVSLNRIRIVLGADEKIPDTLEEARLMAMGGEVVLDNVHNGSGQATQKQQQSGQPEMDEATGLSGWSTVRVKRTTVRQELKEERQRLRDQRRQAALEAEQQAKQAEFRRMEEAKMASADDSALGAFDVWNRGVKEGYKGVDIHSETKVEVRELGKKLAGSDAKVGFKKMGFKAKKKKQNRRTTSADDD